MKGQLGIDFFISLIVFVAFVSYIFVQVSNFKPIYLSQIKAAILRSEAFQLSEILVNDPGYPLNWNDLPSSQIQRIGLSDSNKNQTNMLFLPKINKLNTECNQQNGFENIQQKLDYKKDFMILVVDRTSGNILVNCRPPVIITRNINVSSSRIVSFGTGYGELIVQTW